MPPSFVWITRLNPVAGFVMLTVAPPTAAPVVSVTVPLISPVPDWLNTSPAAARNRRRMRMVGEIL
jgi:hypothetical protein